MLMKILDDGRSDNGAHEFTVEMETGDEPDGAKVRELWKSATDGGDYGVAHAVVRAEGGKADAAALRASLERFNERPDNGWRWTVDAHLLHDLCGVALLDSRYPPTRADGPIGTRATSPPGGRKR